MRRRSLSVAGFLAAVMASWTTGNGALGSDTGAPSSAPVPTPATQAASGSWNLQGPGPHLLVHYMSWFTIHPEGEPTTRQWHHWSWGGKGTKHDPNQFRPDGSRDLAAVYSPLIGPYNSWDRQVIRYHLRTAKAAGIEGITVDWYGKGHDSDKPIAMLLDEAQQAGMKLAICYEEKVNWPAYRHPKTRAQIIDSATSDLQYILKTYADHPAYLKREGKPMIMQFNFFGADELGRRNIQPEEWKTIFARLGRPVAYMRQNLDWDQHPPVQGAYIWWTRQQDYPQRFVNEAEKLRRGSRLQLYMTMVCPGFDDTGVWGWGAGPRVTPRHGTDILERTMKQATVGHPELIQIVTWNDFNEGTVIEPTRENGFAYLDAIETWWHGVSGRPVNLADNRQPLRDLLAHPSDAQREEIERSRPAIERVLHQPAGQGS